MCDWNTSISHRRVCMPGTPEVNHIATAVICFVSGKSTYCCSEWWFELGAIPCWWKNWYQHYRWKWGSVWLNIYPNIPCNSSQLLAYAFTFLPPSEDSTACGSGKGLFWNREISCWKRGCCRHRRQKWSEYFRLKCCWYELWVRSKNKERTLCSLLVDIYFRNLFKLVSTQACLV